MPAARPAADTLTRADNLTPWLERAPASAAAVLVDGAVADSAITASVVAAVERAGARVRVHTRSGPGGAADAHSTAAQICEADLLVAVGGGAVLDRAKAANAVAGGVDLGAYVAAQGPAGALPLAEVARGACLAAVPTTVGTGSERSANAVVATGDRRLLVSGGCLAVDLAVLDPVATRDMPRPLLFEGILEALSRTAGPYIGSPATGATADQLAEAVAARLAAIGCRLADAGPSARADPETRAEIARMSGMSHTSAMHEGRSPFAFRGWYLGHEVSTAAGVGKARGLAATTPPLWRRILAGDTVWGSADRLRRIWSCVRQATPGDLPEDPAEGMEHLLARWGVAADLPAPLDAEALAERVLARWGGDLPYLAGVGRDEARRVLAPLAGAPQSTAWPGQATGRGSSGTPRARR